MDGWLGRCLATISNLIVGCQARTLVAGVSLAVRLLLEFDMLHPIIVEFPSVRLSSQLDHEFCVGRGRLTALSAFKKTTIAASPPLALQFGQGTFIRESSVVPAEWKTVVK